LVIFVVSPEIGFGVCGCFNWAWTREFHGLKKYLHFEEFLEKIFGKVHVILGAHFTNPMPVFVFVPPLLALLGPSVRYPQRQRAGGSWMVTVALAAVLIPPFRCLGHHASPWVGLGGWWLSRVSVAVRGAR
jgi:hypothetical protein